MCIRDRVLRHQHKLHAALIGNELQQNLSNQLDVTHEDIIDKHIVKVTGNKATILPTPTNPMAKSAAQLKKEARDAAKIKRRYSVKTNSRDGSRKNSISNPISVSPMQRSVSSLIGNEETKSTSVAFQEPMSSIQRPLSSTSVTAATISKRHASFSAASAFTYVQDNNNNNAHDQQQINKNEFQFPADIPHQVGFSTPQLSAQQLIEKVTESGVAFESLDMPPFFTLDDPLNSMGMGNDSKIQFNENFNFNEVVSGNYNNNNNNSERLTVADNTNRHAQLNLNSGTATNPGNVVPTDSYLFTPFMLSDFLTMSSSFGGASGFTKPDLNNSNLDYFNYHDTATTSSNTTPYPPSFDNFIPERISSLTPIGATLNNNHNMNINVPIPTFAIQGTHQPMHPNPSPQPFYSKQILPHQVPKSHFVNSPPSNQLSQQRQPGMVSEHSNPHKVPGSSGMEKRWLNDFVSDSNSNLEPNFKLNLEHFNDIGFINTPIPSQQHTLTPLPLTSNPLSRQPSNSANHSSAHSQVQESKKNQNYYSCLLYTSRCV